MHKLSFRKVLLSARTEYVRWLVNPRMIIIAVMLVFVYNFAIAPLQSAAEEMGVDFIGFYRDLTGWCF